MFRCYICGGRISKHNKTGACIRCILVYRNKGWILESRPPTLRCIDCGKTISDSSKSGRCRRCSDLNRRGANHHFYGKHHSEKTKRKLSLKLTGRIISRESALRGAVNRSGSKHHSWNGGKFIEKDGYVKLLMPSHPLCQRTTGYILEHRYVVERYLGRLLNKCEDVHHIDHNRTNNHISNLMVFCSRSAHKRYEMGGQYSPDEIILDGSKLKDIK